MVVLVFVSLFSWSFFYIALLCFFFNDPATTEIYTLSLHDALPIAASSALLALACTIAWARWKRLMPGCSSPMMGRPRRFRRRAGSGSMPAPMLVPVAQRLPPRPPGRPGTPAGHG